ncbi:MAG: HD domain-containing protein [Bacteroidetes bacterium]|nr:HD domain-containing protein [Bacteroidota bacterium]
MRIINDPIYGLVKIPTETIFELIEHPFFQRLRRIRQLGMTHLVYPGAHHTRFHHAIGAMYLMGEAIEVLRSKGHAITNEEAEAVTMAILLHDIGHGPFSHALEDSIASGIRHEELSELFMDRLNRDFSGKLSMAIQLFRNNYPKKFLHQLVSSQLDMDRLDYLNRDSFFTGVSEGVISSDRIIMMLDVVQDELAIEAKGIYSIEKFIVSRRLMYWQVYLHKTVVSAECLLINILRRAKELSKNGVDLFGTPALKKFLSAGFTKKDFLNDESLLNTFAELDDSDITSSVKVWSKHEDKILQELCRRMISRKLFKIILQNEEITPGLLHDLQAKIKTSLKIKDEEMNYFLLTGKLVNNAYSTRHDKINIVFKDGSVKDISEATDTLNIKALSEPVEKFYVCFPKMD